MKIPEIKTTKVDNGHYLYSATIEETEDTYGSNGRANTKIDAIAVLAYLELNEDLELLTVDGEDVELSDLMHS